MASSRKKWILIGIGGLVFLLLAGVAGGIGAWVYFEQRTANWLAKAEEHFSKEEWALAKSHFGLYLKQEPKDFDALEKYAQASLSIPGNRVNGLRRAATAYNQIVNFDPTRADIKVKLLNLHEKLRNWGQIIYFTNLLLEEPAENRPDDQTLRHYRAKALDGLGRREAAMEAYRKLIDSGQARAEVYGRLARLLAGRELNRQAGEVWQQAQEALADDPLFYLEYGNYFLEQQKIDEAAKHLARAAELAPDNAKVQLAQTRLTLLGKKWDEAIALGEKAIATDPNLSDAHLALAQAHWRRGDTDKGIEILEAVSPLVLADSPGIFLRKAELQLAAKRVDDAKATIEAYAKTYPAHGTTVDYLEARVLLDEGSPEAAAERLVTVVERNPNLTVAEFFLALARLKAGQQDRAKSTLEAYLRKNPSDTTAKDLLARLTGNQRDLPSAVAHATSTLDKEDATPEAQIGAAYTLFEASSREGAVAAQADMIAGLFEQTIQEDPESPEAYLGLADLRAALEDYPAAQNVLERALAAGVPQEDIWRAQANVFLAEGNVEKARGVFTKDLARTDVSVDEVISWCGLFERRGQSEAPLAMLLEAKEAFDDEGSKARLDAERVAVTVRGGDGEGALALLPEIEKAINGHESAQRALHSAKIQIARFLMADSPTEERDRAQQLVQEVVASGHEEAAIHVVEGRIALAQDEPDYETAQAAFLKALDLDDTNLAALSGLAHVALAKGEISKALGFLESAGGLAPGNTSLQIRRAEILVRTQRFFEARQVLDKVLKREPKNLAAMEMMVNAYLALAQLDQAEKTLQRLESAVTGDADHARAVSTLRGKIMLAKGEGAKAEELLREQYETNPDDFAMLRNLAFTLSRQGRTEEAEGLLKKYCDQNITDPAGFVALAKFYLASNKRQGLDKASTALTRALLIDRDHLPALREMIELQTRRGSAGDVLGICERYLERDPANAPVLYLKASFLRQEPSRVGEALQSVERAIELDQRPEYLAVRGLILLDKGETEKALQDLQTFSREMPDTPARIDAALAEAYVKLGDKELANSFYTAAVRKVAQGHHVKADVMQRVAQALKQEANKG